MERDGKWYCGIHDPAVLAAKKAKREAEWNARWEVRKAAWSFAEQAQRVCEGVPAETLAELGPGWLKKHLEGSTK